MISSKKLTGGSHDTLLVKHWKIGYATFRTAGSRRISTQQPQIL
jgi:hypothetical protein